MLDLDKTGSECCNMLNVCPLSHEEKQAHISPFTLSAMPSWECCSLCSLIYKGGFFRGQADGVDGAERGSKHDAERVCC